MQKKVVVALLVLVLLPLGLLGWIGARMAENERQLLKHQMGLLAQGQLQQVDERIQAHFAGLQTRLSASTPKEANANALRDWLRTAPQVRQVLVIEGEGADAGKRLFPPAEVTGGERLFLQRTAALWENPSLLMQSAHGAAAANGDAEPATQGWYSWYWNAELHHIYWQRDAKNRIWGFELDPARLKADLIGVLPASGGKGDALARARIRMIDGNGATVYQWGGFEPPEKAKSLAMLPMSPPLASWKLEYYGAGLTGASAAGRFQMLAGILVLAIALAGLAFYLYREQTRQMREAAERVNFVNQVSHELKTPLTNIRMYAELLEDQLAEAEEKPRRYLGVIIAESQRLSRLIANVLNFARDQKEKLKVQPAPGCCDAVVARCIEAFAPALSAKGVDIRLDAQAPEMVQVDAETLEQILNNLFSNVEKYGAAGGALQVTTHFSANSTVITVRDFGPGIPERERERIFQPFYRVSSKLSDGVAGTGIGLDIARKLARLHGGDLNLVPCDSGACFELSLATPLVEGK
ncbi:MAG: Sensor histidine kinase YycG [Betaproteobacteria bacterium ADurb.Bin341]|nr:MAG: Sensor histidine kinase YycG [Betaproteobacteria bacterium ADurb.Bin341]